MENSTRNLVEVLLACYQGELFLADQLDSLFNQSYQNFTILVRDDGSKDNTCMILKDYAARFPGRIKILPKGNQMGPSGNFNALLEKASADYIFFSDQDDIWEKNKIELTLNAFNEAERKSSKLEPLLIHTDLTVVDKENNTIHESFWRYCELDPELGKPLNRLLVQNTVTGCTTAINKALRNLVFPIPKEALMHDWWMALSASAVGEVISLPEKTVRYRQHGQNALGAVNISLKEGLKKFIEWIKDPEANTYNAHTKHVQGALLYQRFSEIMSAFNLKVLQVFLKAPTLSKIERKWIYLSYQFYRQGIKKIIPYLFQNRPF